ncbi:uncharacterized protein BDCG_00595 [Blastomyces dermatitidis ER-3]|uniref:Tat pathway signal sequence n=1 Tax=Ajellomyces dermatitidis (strain ER-3 / ATCC MYA-2586) TaxID=559297 RepID=A0ABP2EKT0_AJEDR|nr:uncharacterized protein BDCG_00595 [Blastomyces dermatitidis ER-3]EEQ83790.2 hypothetical protein BDCG_00595 [Blastomyces dermatitidis ER-3]
MGTVYMFNVSHAEDKIQLQKGFESWRINLHSWWKAFTGITQQQADSPEDNSVEGETGGVDIKLEGLDPYPPLIRPRYMHRDSSIENLESGVAEGLQFLGPLKSLLQKYSRQPSENRWLKQIEELEKRAVSARVIIGVVGTTGAGKSSLINAILDEERLVPTNSMRACIAVVTEISFNHSPNRYRAEIEFISLAEWEEELNLIFGDIKLENQQTRDNSDSAIACAKATAVYPDIPDILKSSIKELLVHENVSNLLGKTVEFAEDDPVLFYTKLQKYVDSKTQTRRKGMNGKSKANDRKDMKFWPLIRVVRLYVKAPVLATGAVIVDLPGTQDANAARAAVASRYIERCSSLWIVAPITRATDPKWTALFICSKTDDINLSEIVVDFDDIVDEPFSTPDIPEISITRLEEQLRALKEERTELVISIDELCEEMATLGCDFDLLKSTDGSPKRNFVDGVRQLDEADAEEESFDPSVDLRDYDQVARALPVFCVSSKAYQKLKGRLRRDHAVKAFCNPEDTEIPDLQAHCLSLTIAQRTSGCDSARGPSDSLCEERQRNDPLFLQNGLDILQQGLENLTGEVLAEITSAVEDNIFDKFGASPRLPPFRNAIPACNEAGKALAQWNRSRKVSPEGLAWNTYKAICRRQGVYKHHDWNSTLIRPMMPVLAVGWERSFSRLIPKILTRYSKTTYGYVKALYASLEPRISAGAVGSKIAEKLKVQLPTYRASFKELSAASSKILCESHKAANRAFVPIIAAELGEAYEGCGSAMGRGVYLRMKDIMTQHVEKRRHEMFHKSTEHVKSELEGSIQSVRDYLAMETEKLFQKISWDYKNAFEKSQTAEEKTLNKELRKLLQM